MKLKSVSLSVEPTPPTVRKDKFTKEKRSQVMSAIKSKNTKIEKDVFKILRQRGVYFRKHHDKIYGKPDISQPAKKRAVFVDGNFWHGWRYPAWKHKLPNSFWTDKIERNRKRDKKVTRKLRSEGWFVMRVWEHQLKKGKREVTIEKIVVFLSDPKQPSP